MIIAHLPSGYVFSALARRYFKKAPVSETAFMIAGIVGAIAPDFDMAYFYLIDHRQTHHHKYFTHWPIVWLGLLFLSMLWFYQRRQSKPACLSLIVCCAAILHLLLDSVVGDVWWLMPFVDRPYALFTVPARFNPWWLNFILHWSFALEIAITVWAALIFHKRHKSTASNN